MIRIIVKYSTLLCVSFLAGCVNLLPLTNCNKERNDDLYISLRYVPPDFKVNNAYLFVYLDDFNIPIQKIELAYEHDNNSTLSIHYVFWRSSKNKLNEDELFDQNKKYRFIINNKYQYDFKNMKLSSTTNSLRSCALSSFWLNGKIVGKNDSDMGISLKLEDAILLNSNE